MKTRTLISRFFLTIGRLLVVCLFLLNATGVAHADAPIIDGDALEPYTGASVLDFGNQVCVGTTVVKPILIGINRVGDSAKNSFANNAVVSINVENLTGAGLSISLKTGNQIQLPDNWAGLKNNTMSSELIEASLTLVASSNPGPYSGSITISGTGLNQEKTSDYVTRKLTLPVTATIVSCDTTPPTINVPANITAEATGATGAAVTFSANADDTNPLHPAVTCTPASGSTFPLGTTTVTCSATDAAGNTGSKSFTITVQDTTGPTFDAVSNVTAEATGAAGTMVTYTTPGATDAVDGAISSVTCSPASGSTFAISSTLVTCSATDSRNNLGQTSFNIIVQDTTKPVLALPGSVEQEAASAAGAEVTYTASASDVVDGAIIPTCKPTSGDIFPLGSTTVGCSATDAHSNTVTGSFAVNVVDTTAPALTLPASFSAEATGPDGAVVTFDTSAVDLVDGAVSVTCSPASGSVFPLGTTTVVCSAADTHHNSAEKSFNITVVDTTPPSLTLPADQKLEATGPSGAAATSSASASDTVDTDPVVTCDYDSGHIFPLGKTKVSCTATDDAGNIATSEFTIEVVDTTPPALSLPASFSKEATSSAGAVATYTATANDLVDGAVVPVCSPASGSTFPLDINTVSCTATDQAGNAASGTFSVTVVDTTPPDISVTYTSPVEATGPDGAEVTYTASALDIVDGVRPVSCTPASSTIFGLGETQVTCTSMDTRSNKGTKIFSITVQDTTPPVLHLPAPITEEATSPAGAIVSYSPTATDLVDGEVAVTCQPPSGSTFALGVTSVTCTATDSHKNTANGSFSVKVQDTIAPTVECSTPNSSWSGSDITVACTASDSGSGLANPNDASFILTTNVADGLETTDAATDSRVIKDVVGNSTQAGPYEGLKVDKAAPTYACGTADSAWHNTDVNIACTAADGGSGLTTPATFSLSTHVSDGEEIANALTDGAVVSDLVGHNVTIAPISGNQIDKKAPQLVSCDQPDGLWHAANVSLNCTYSDGGSGPATQTVALSTAIADGEETNNAQASTTQRAKDAVGNLSPVPASIAGNQIDRKAPVISIEAPLSSYLLNQNVTVKFSCTDGGSGVATCQGTQANGAALDTSTVGTHTFTVTSTDGVGNSSTKTVTYTVKYASVGTQCMGHPGHQILQPINLDGSSVFKKGSTVPVKFRVCDANGNSVSTAGIVKSFTYSYSGNSTTDMVNEPVYSTTPDTNFRWSASDQQWIYNLSTKSSNFSVTTNANRYIFTITLDDGSNIPFIIGLK